MAILDWPEALRSLRVCFGRGSSSENCGECFKCQVLGLFGRIATGTTLPCLPRPLTEEDFLTLCGPCDVNRDLRLGRTLRHARARDSHEPSMDLVAHALGQHGAGSPPDPGPGGRVACPGADASRPRRARPRRARGPRRVRARSPVPKALPMATGPLPATSLATFGGGCFWCAEAIFDASTAWSTGAGYAGERPAPHLQQVCSGDTGTRRSSRSATTRRRSATSTLLEIFWKTHDPTTPNRRGTTYGDAVPFDRPLPRRRAAKTAESVKTAIDAAARSPRRRHADRPVHDVLEGRGLPPGHSTRTRSRLLPAT